MPDEATVYEAISDPTRRRILDRLARGECRVNDLAAPFAMSRPAVSQHLRVLREAGLVTDRKVGRERYYRLQAEPLTEVDRWLGTYRRFWQERVRALGTFLDAEAKEQG